MSRDINGFDLETASKDQRHAAYGGLEPWRLAHGTVFVTSATICRPDGSLWSAHRRTMGDAIFEMCFVDMLKSMKGQVVYCHNGVFDIAWSLGSVRKSRSEPVPSIIRDIRWHDTIPLTKWVINGQKADYMNFSLSLRNVIESFLKDDPLTEEFVRMKDEKVDPGMDPYWERRNQMDAIMTQRLAVYMEDNLPATCRNGYSTEATNLVPLANAWLKGIRINQERLAQVQYAYETEQKEIIDRIKIAPSVLTSPKQLSHLLFNQLHLTPESFTPTGSPSSRADDIKVIGYKVNQSGDPVLGKLMTDIIRYKQIATLMSKYVKGAWAALDHTGDGYIYGAPRIFATYTGRFTYSSKTLDTWQTSLALHQLPRKAKEIRSFMEAPEGYEVYEADASAQESRLMAIRSNDPTMIMIFNRGMDFHCMTASSILGREYQEFFDEWKSGDKAANENRQYGKLVNLAGNYRIGANALARKGFEEYDIILQPDKAWYFLNVFKSRYSGIPVYWDEAIKFAKANGYAQTLGGRRYKIFDWSGSKTWASESSALMVPIQGTGADQKNIAIKEIYENVPDVDFGLDLHDATFDWIPIDRKEELKKQIDDVLQNIQYEKYWGFKPPVSLPFESHMGHDFSTVK